MEKSIIQVLPSQPSDDWGFLILAYTEWHRQGHGSTQGKTEVNAPVVLTWIPSRTECGGSGLQAVDESSHCQCLSLLQQSAHRLGDRKERAGSVWEEKSIVRKRRRERRRLGDGPTAVFVRRLVGGAEEANKHMEGAGHTQKRWNLRNLLRSTACLLQRGLASGGTTQLALKGQRMWFIVRKIFKY